MTKCKPGQLCRVIDTSYNSLWVLPFNIENDIIYLSPNEILLYLRQCTKQDYPDPIRHKLVVVLHKERIGIMWAKSLKAIK